MSALSRFLSRDALAAAAVAVLMAGPADAAARRTEPAKAPAAKVATVAKPLAAPLSIRVAAARRQEEELRLAGVRRAYDGLVSTRNLIQEGTETCLRDQRWFLMKVRDSLYDDGTTPPAHAVDGAVERLRKASDQRAGQLSASRAAMEIPMPGPVEVGPPSRAAHSAQQSDVDRLQASVGRLNGLRGACLGWAERTIEQVQAATGAPMGARLERIRTAMASAKADYQAMQGVTPESAGEDLAAMDLGTRPDRVMLGSL